MSRPIRQSEIARRRTRREKLRKLRAKYAKARTEGERKFILSRVARIAPTVTPEQFIETVRARQ